LIRIHQKLEKFTEKTILSSKTKHGKFSTPWITRETDFENPKRSSPWKAKEMK
jgi:hypothetical protein